MGEDANSTRGWSRGELRAFVGETAVMARDAELRTVALPEPVADLPGATYDAPPWEDHVASMFRLDRPKAAKAWLDCLNMPAEIIQADIRRRQEDGWHLVTLRYLNVLEQWDAIVVCHTDHGLIPEPRDNSHHDEHATYERPLWAILHLDDVGTVLRAEGMVDDVFGKTAAELTDDNILSVIHADDHDAALAMWLDLLAEGGTRTLRQRSTADADGEVRWLDSTVINHLDDPQVGAVVVVCHDITEQRAREAALRASEEQFRSLAEEMPAAVFRADRAGHISFGNSNWDALVGRCPDIVLTIFDLFCDDTALRVRWRQLVDEGTPVDIEESGSCGRVLRIRVRRNADHGQSEFAVIGTVEDVTATAVLRRRAESDGLTGLANRMSLDEHLARALSGDPSGVAVFFVDLDGFKWVNDRYGHTAGDHVLKEVGRRLRAVIRPGDLVARYGGDEFVLLCPRVERGDDIAIRERLVEALIDPILIGGASWQPRASIGMVRPMAGEDRESVIRRADAEMYRHKHNQPVEGSSR